MKNEPSEPTNNLTTETELPAGPEFDAAHGSANGEKLRAEIATALNRFSAENGSNTPDFILAEYLTNCLSAFDAATARREKWYGYTLSIGRCGPDEGDSQTVRISDPRPDAPDVR